MPISTSRRHWARRLTLIAAALGIGVAGSAAAATQCRSVPAGMSVTSAPGVAIHVRTVGRGKPILMIPSLGRGVGDFGALAAALAPRGFMSILPDPRMTGRSSMMRADDLFALAADDAAVIRTLCDGPVDVIGHAFGNRVARSLASASPHLVDRLALLAGGGEVPLPDAMRDALTGSFEEGKRPDAERLKDIQTAFFARGNDDPSVWLRGWYPAAAEGQRFAGGHTDTARWWTAGKADLLLIQAAEDPIAPAGNAAKLRADVGKRLTLVNLGHASHAMLPEQPRAIAAAIAGDFGGPESEAALQRTLDRETVLPRGTAKPR